MEATDTDAAFMDAAIQEAKKGDPALTSPNPRVGAVIVESGRIVARGYFERDGEPHAEKRALENLGRRPQSNAVMYVTLEPCSTKGRTGACTDAIIQAGITKVFIGATDPTPAHRGNGLKVLREAGVDVVSGLRKQECEALNLGFLGRVS